MSFVLPRLELRAASRPLISSELTPYPQRLTISEGDKLVFCDEAYDFAFIFDEMPEHITANLYFNDEFVLTAKSIVDNTLILTPKDATGKDIRPFSDLLGFVQVKVVLSTGTTEKIAAYSECFLVMIRDNYESQKLKRISNFIAKNYEGLLSGKDSPKDLVAIGADCKAGKFSDLIELTQKVISSYKTYMGFFRSHAHTKLVPAKRKDSFEKIKSFSTSTVSFILKHPDELRRVDFRTGISVLGSNYLPKHIEVDYNIHSKDTYENRVVLGFIGTVTETLETEVKVMESVFPGLKNTKTIEGYVSSAEVVMEFYARELMEVKSQLLNLVQELKSLKRTFALLLPLTSQSVRGRPIPTKVFTQVGVYRHFFNLMSKWCFAGSRQLQQEKFIYSLVRSSQIFEVYGLIKLIEEYESIGFEITAREKYNYEVSSDIPQVSVDLHNTYTLKRGNETVTLYYQPVIFGKNHVGSNGINLKRLTSLSFKDNSAGGAFYTPDYIVKTEDGKRAKYEIIDAKYSSLATLKNYYAADAAFKYLTSIRLTRKDDEFIGLRLFYFKGNEIEKYSFFDLLSDDELGLGPHFDAQRLLPPQD